MAAHDTLEDLALRLDMLEQITLNMANVVCRQDAGLRSALIEEFEQTIKDLDELDRPRTDRSAIVRAFLKQMRSA